MEVEHKLVSIIIPVYNAEHFLERCYHSLKEKTYPHLEFIFVNDGSKDRSLEYLQMIQKEDHRVMILDQKQNKGVSAARNAGLEICRGEYIAFCDADDGYEPEMVASMVAALEQNHADIACCAICRSHESGKSATVLWQASCELAMTSEDAIKNWLTGQYIGNSVYSKLSKRHIWENVRFPEGEIFEEAYVIPQLLSRAGKVVHTGKASYHYYYGHESLATAPMTDRILAVFKREDYIRDYIGSRYRDLEDAVVSYEVRNNLGCMIGAEVSKNRMDPAVYEEVKRNFNRVFIPGLKNQYVSARDKLRLIEVKTKLFYLRKRITGQIL